ncbi:MAG: hypothetical protein WCJ81_06290 [bacterium]
MTLKSVSPVSGYGTELVARPHISVTKTLLSQAFGAQESLIGLRRMTVV